MISIQQMSHRYGEGSFALHVADWSVEAGSSVALIGSSGSGKTTLLNLISGVLKPRDGLIRTNDVEISGLPDAARRDFRLRNIGLIFQEFELLEYLNVLDNILLPYRISPALALDRAVRQRAAELAEETGLAGALHRNIQHLSQGERQRVALCRALLPEPALLLADEPTGNLDPENTRHVLDILFAQVRRHNTTLISVTHDHTHLQRFDEVTDLEKLSPPS